MAERNTNTWLDTPDPQVFIKNSAKFNDLMMMYRCTVREVRTKLEVLNDEFSLEYKRNPISFIKTRIKKPESIYKKLKKLGYEFTAENIQNQLNDVAGIRVVCAFIDDIYTIADLITRQDDITVIQVKDYIKNPKPNGYRSYHMIVEIPVFFSKGKTPMRAEIQPHPYIKNELSRIFLEDLYDGSRRTGFFAKKADVTEFLNSWLDKYKSQEELQELLKRIL